MTLVTAELPVRGRSFPLAEDDWFQELLSYHSLPKLYMLPFANHFIAATDISRFADDRHGSSVLGIYTPSREKSVAGRVPPAIHCPSRGNRNALPLRGLQVTDGEYSRTEANNGHETRERYMKGVSTVGIIIVKAAVAY